MHAFLPNKSKTSSNIQVHLILIHFFPKKKTHHNLFTHAPSEKNKFMSFFFSKHSKNVQSPQTATTLKLVSCKKNLKLQKKSPPLLLSYQKKSVGKIAPKNLHPKGDHFRFTICFKWNRGQAAMLSIIICTCRWSAHASIKGLEKSWSAGIRVMVDVMETFGEGEGGRFPRAKYWRCILNQRLISSFVSISS